MVIDALIDRIKDLRNPVCVGLDPREDLIPRQLLDKHGSVPDAYLEFSRSIIDAVCDIVPCVKPQIAMYERYGAAGFAVYEQTVKYAKERGLFVIGDVKRGDIASTASAYAEGHLGGAMSADFVTVNPYLGRDAVEPFVEACRKYDKGVFVLVKTSNPGSADLQDLDVGGEKLYQRVGGMVAVWGKELTGKYGYSSVGAVVGATWPSEARELRTRMPNTFFLIPGYGAQGGTAEDVAVCFDKNSLGGVVNASRGIIAAWQKQENAGKDFALCARDAALLMIEDLRSHINIKS